jgi:hypothetical protein
VTSLAFTAAAASAVESARLEEVTRLSEFYKLLTELAAAEADAAAQLAQQQAQSLPLIHAVHSSSNDVEQLVVGATATATAVGASTPAVARHRGGASRGLSQVMFMKFHSDLLQREREGSVGSSSSASAAIAEQFPVATVVPRHAPRHSGASLSGVNEESAADVSAGNDSSGASSSAVIDTDTAATPAAAVVATARSVSLGELAATAITTGSSADDAAAAAAAGDLQQQQQQHQQQHTLTRCASEPKAVGINGLLQQQSNTPADYTGTNGSAVADTGSSDSRRNSSSIRRLRSASSSGSLGSTVHDAAAAAQLERPSPRTLMVSVYSSEHCLLHNCNCV